MSLSLAAALSATLLVGVALGRWSARRTVRHLREQLWWRIALGLPGEGRYRPQHRAPKPAKIPPAPVLVSPYNLPPPIHEVPRHAPPPHP